MNNKSKAIIGVLWVGSMAVCLNASALTQNVKAILRKDIVVKVEGQSLSLTGNEPLVYNGVTYLPIRKVGEAVNKEVKWDAKTNTIDLVKAGLGDKVPVVIEQNAYNPKKSSLARHTFGREYAYVEESNLSADFDHYFKPNGKTKFEAVFINQTNQDKVYLTVTDKSEGNNKGMIYEAVLPFGQEVKVEFDVTGMSEFRLETENDNPKGFVSMVDAYWQ